jgi:hypothetical protein
MVDLVDFSTFFPPTREKQKIENVKCKLEALGEIRGQSPPSPPFTAFDGTPNEWE